MFLCVFCCLDHFQWGLEFVAKCSLIDTCFWCNITILFLVIFVLLRFFIVDN
uniref:Uncharacterized protein n=1 Tax=Rhizophora mucronata TaxID=61149 RepID=A0A2P2PGY8_RHIMU